MKCEIFPKITKKSYVILIIRNIQILFPLFHQNDLFHMKIYTVKTVV